MTPFPVGPAPDMTDMHSLDIFRHYDRSHWRLADLDLSGIDPALVRPEYVTLVKSAVMGESNVIAAVHDFAPRLPWLLYRFTQALVHLLVMRGFGRHLAAMRALRPRSTT